MTQYRSDENSSDEVDSLHSLNEEELEDLKIGNISPEVANRGELKVFYEKPKPIAVFESDFFREQKQIYVGTFKKIVKSENDPDYICKVTKYLSSK